MTRSLRTRPRVATIVLLILVGLLAGLWRRSSSNHAAELERMRAREVKRLAEEQAGRRALQAAARYRAFQQQLGPLLREIESTRTVFYIKNLTQMRKRMEEVEGVVQKLAKLAEDPAHAEHGVLWSLQGIGWYFLGRGDRAERCLQRAARLAPKDGAVRYYLGRVYLDRAMAVKFAFGVDDPEGESRRWTRRAVEVMSSAHDWGGVSELDRQLALAYRALAGRREDEVRRLSQAGLERFAGKLGVEEFWSLIAWVERGDQRAAAFRKVIEARPHSYWQHYFLGSMAHKLGNIETALKRYAACLQINPSFALAYNNRAVIYETRGNLAAARADIELALQYNPTSIQATLNRGNIRAKQGDLPGALADYTAAVRLNPRFARGHFNQGLILFGMKRYDASIEKYDRAIALRPSYADAWSNRGNAYFQKKDYISALRDYEKAIVLSPATSGTAHYNRGNLRFLRGNLIGAKADYDQAIKRQPEFAAAWASLGQVAFKRGDYRAAVAAFDRGVALGSQAAEVYCNRGSAYLHLKQYGRAITDYDRALKLNPVSAEYHRARGNARQLNGDLREALRDYDAAIRLEPRLVETYANRAGLKAQLKDLEGAVADYKVATRLRPRDWTSWYLYGMTLARLRQYDRAVVALQRSRRVAPEAMRSRIDGWIRKIRGR